MQIKAGKDCSCIKSEGERNGCPIIGEGAIIKGRDSFSLDISWTNHLTNLDGHAIYILLFLLIYGIVVAGTSKVGLKDLKLPLMSLLPSRSNPNFRRQAFATPKECT